MENNFVVRRTLLNSKTAYNQITQDFQEAFEGFDGVSFESFVPADDGVETTNEKEHMVIYLDKNKHQFLKITKDDTSIVKVSLHCGTGTVEGENFVYIETKSKNDHLSYNFARTAYGVVFSTFPYFSDVAASVSDGYLQCFFTTFKDYKGNEINGFIYCSNSNDEIDSSKSYITTEDHVRLETFQTNNSFNGGNANHTVLFNAVSYSNAVIAPHLFRKFQAENKKFGRVKLNGKTFISGSHFCLETKEE